MISKTLDESMKKAMKYENMTKASNFANIYENINKENLKNSEIEMLQKLSEYVKNESAEQTEQQDAEIMEYITENPEKIAPVLDFSDRPSTGLPFFKSIDYKLSEVFGV
ncbi:hypothetical protein J6N69_05585 [bacterium]|nr:hypothetical protein [bacterium]MBP3846124.1 hypothetical protein [bacterium]